MVSVPALLDGESTLPPEHDERPLGIAPSTSLSRSVGQLLADRPDARREEWRSIGRKPLTRWR